ncbi:hypothetical protein H072_10586 [Dactylellina haptotyla CBS 200.50]|uniref:Uncharacterized protein n=1 Tax=Dactylellina haptotyla (strain CBS 200.50) TaxID=1284197 RepID=S7ZZU1_DACHA|nr:hypothetical protein H072_10586 [Dactylellina haptotyla CBS 200.50]
MATVLSSQPRHVLTPLSPKRRTVLGNVTNIVRGLDAPTTFDGKGFSYSKPSALTKKPLLSQTNGKRSFYTIYDENSAPPSSTTQHKRMKSHLSPTPCEENTIAKYALVTKPVSPVPSGIIVSKKKSNVPSSAAPQSLKPRTHVTSSSSPAPTIGSSGRSAVHSSALSRKDSLASLSATSPAKGIKRKIQKSVRRVDPPSHLSKSGSQGAEATGASIDGRLIATPVTKTGNATATTWRPGQQFPKSWMFEIHEDTLEETLTNLMYHGAGTLDISDEEDQKKGSELDRVGKENIPPAPTEDQLAMPPPPAPRREESSDDMDSERIRSPLGEADVEIFYPNLKKEREEAEKLRQMKAAQRKSGGMLTSKFAVIDSIVDDYLKHSKKAEDEVLDTAAAVPLPADDDEDEAVPVADKVPAVVKAEAKVNAVEVDENTQTRSLAEDELFDDDL